MKKIPLDFDPDCLILFYLATDSGPLQLQKGIFASTLPPSTPSPPPLTALLNSNLVMDIESPDDNKRTLVD